MAMASMLHCKLPTSQQAEKEQSMWSGEHTIVIVAAYQPLINREHACRRQPASVGRAWEVQLGYQSASAAMALSTVLVICVSQIL